MTSVASKAEAQRVHGRVSGAPTLVVTSPTSFSLLRVWTQTQRRDVCHPLPCQVVVILTWLTDHKTTDGVTVIHAKNVYRLFIPWWLINSIMRYDVVVCFLHFFNTKVGVVF